MRPSLSSPDVGSLIGISSSLMAAITFLSPPNLLGNA